MKKIILVTFSFLLIPHAQAACPDGKTYPIHFTFDDGPHNVLTPRVLDILKEEKVPSTFFVLGEYFKGGKNNPNTKTKYALLDRMKKEGHKIGSHTYSHIQHPSSKYSEEEVVENIMKSNRLLDEYLSPVLRLPYGAGYFRSSNPRIQARNDFIMNTIKTSGMKHVAWDIDTNDWSARHRPTLLPTLLKNICSQKGGVVLFHDVQAHTVENLHDWIKAVKKEGHTFVGLEEFVPEASNPLPPEACGPDYESKAVESLNKEVKEIIRKIKD